MTFEEALLSAQGLPQHEAEQIVVGAYRKATGKSLSRVDLYSNLQSPFPAEGVEWIENWTALRSEGRPLQQILGYQAFLEHEYILDQHVLIPRPETEVLVQTAMDVLREPELGIEIGLGSGIISIELLSYFPELEMYASEVSVNAQVIASKNAQRWIDPIRLHVLTPKTHLEVLEPFTKIKDAHFIITNPPYLASTSEMENDVLKYEPHGALFAPATDPVHFYRKIAEQGKGFLREGGYVFAEIPHERSEIILGLFKDQGWSAEILKDLNQRDRVLKAQR